MERYREYKNSGVQWLGEIPSHWKAVQLGKLFNIKAGGDAKPDVYSETQDAIHPYPVYTNTKSETDVYAFTSMPTCEANTITVTGRGEVGHAIFRTTPYDAIIRLLSLTPKLDVACKYYAYFVDTVIPFTSDSAAIGQLSAVQIKPKPVLLLPKEEQNAIVSYLDTKCSRIEILLSNKEKEISLLQEMKQRIITDAVTRGLNPNVKFKSTNIPWLPEIPEHWEEKRLSTKFTGDVEANKNFEYKHAFKFNYGELVPKNEVGTPEEYKDVYVKYSLIKKGDVLINGLNLNYDFVSQRVACAPADGIITSAYVVCRPRQGANYDYYTFLFKAMDNMKLFHGMGSGIRLTLSFKELKKQILPVPPLSEQQAIVSYITERTSKIDSLVEKLNKEIECIKEYKQRLISDVVTGQIKVC